MRNLIGIEPDYVMVTALPVLRGHGRRHRRHHGAPTRAAFYDPYLKKEGFKQGRIHLDGYNAMAFSRIRKGLAGGDFDRSANQQRTLRGIHARIRVAGVDARLHRARRDDGHGAHGHQRLARPSSTSSPRRSPRSTRAGSPPAWSGAGSASSAPRAWSSPTSPRPVASAARPGPTRPCGTADVRAAPPAGFEPAAPGTGNQCSIP